MACDVDNPLLGPNGAAAVYGPQKGATPDDVARLDGRCGAGRTRSRRPPAPTAGMSRAPARPAGSGFAAIALLGAQLRPGIDWCWNSSASTGIWPVPIW